MKIIYQILILIFVLLSLFIIKDDILSLYNKNFTKQEVKATTTNKSVESVLVDKASSILELAETPGALRVDNSTNTKESEALSIKGVISFTNKNRVLNGNLAALTESKELNASAKVKLDDMFAKQYFEHVSPDGLGVSDLATKASYEYITIGENLALGNFTSDYALVGAWMASTGHKANILNKKYTDIGVAIGRGVFEGRNVWIAVQHFGLAKRSWPEVDEKLHDTVVVNEKTIKSMGADLALQRDRIDSGVVYQGYTTNEQINQYNELVVKYNKLVEEIKSKISLYNATVRAFNDCLASATSS